MVTIPQTADRRSIVKCKKKRQEERKIGMPEPEPAPLTGKKLAKVMRQQAAQRGARS
jgi:hypothetical protein